MPEHDIKSLTKAIQRREYGILPEAINLIGDSLESVHLGVDNLSPCPIIESNQRI